MGRVPDEGYSFAGGRREAGPRQELRRGRSTIRSSETTAAFSTLGLRLEVVRYPRHLLSAISQVTLANVIFHSSFTIRSS